MNYQYLIILGVLLIISLIVIKMRRKDFSIEINKLIQYLGGKENIIDSQINLSRLKVTLKDMSLVNKEGIQKLGAKGIVDYFLLFLIVISTIIHRILIIIYWSWSWT